MRLNVEQLKVVLKHLSMDLENLADCVRDDIDNGTDVSGLVDEYEALTLAVCRVEQELWYQEAIARK